MLSKIFIFFIRIYQYALSPCLHFFGGSLIGCRFTPTCSHYYIESLKKRGFIMGNILGIWRILRCNPWGKFGEDPVPLKKTK